MRTYKRIFLSEISLPLILATDREILKGVLEWTPCGVVWARSQSGVIALLSWARYFTLTAPLLIWACEWVMAN